MDNTASETAEHRSHACQEEFQVGFQPSSVCPASPVTIFQPSSHHTSNLSSSSSRSSQTQSRSSKRKYCSFGTYSALDLPAAQAAAMEEQMKQMELDETLRRSKQETQAEECRLLDSQTRRDTGWLREALRRARETLTRKLEREQRLGKAEQHLEIAKLRSTAPSSGGTPPFSHAPSDISKLFSCPPPPVQARQASMPPFTPQPSQSSLLPPHTPLFPVPTAPPPVPQPNVQTTATVTLANPAVVVQGPASMTPKTMGLPPAPALTLPSPHLPAPAITSTSQVTSSVGPFLAGGPASTAGAPLCGAPANPLGLPSFAVYQPTGSGGQAARDVPRPSLPVFESGRESDLVQLKLALDNLLGADLRLSEQYKYQVFLGQIKLPSALQLARAYMHDPAPYTSALQALKQRYGQPRRLVQAILNAPALKTGDTSAFCSFACSVQSLVGMLKTLEGQNGYELHCSSHVDCLLSKMPHAYCVDFIEYCLRNGILHPGFYRAYTLQDLAAWLQLKSQAEQISSQVAALYQTDTPRPAERSQRTAQPKEKPTDVWLKPAKEATAERPSRDAPARAKAKPKPKPYCPYCDRCEHYLHSCQEFRKLNVEQISEWLKYGNRCQKCGRNHTKDWCTLRRPCKVCKEMHLTVLHESVQKTEQKV